MQIAYFTKTKARAFLTITTLGLPFVGGREVTVTGKREANAYCKANGIKPWNF